MPLKPKLSLTLAIDTNVALDLANECDEVVDSFATIRSRIEESILCVPPTVILELGHAVEFGETPEKRAAAMKFLRQYRAWNIRLVAFAAAGRTAATSRCNWLRARGILPP